MPPTRTVTKRIDDIECLRALAVFGVAMHHANADLYAPSPLISAFVQVFGLWIGVDLFFAISGFVIGCSLLRQMQTGIETGHTWHMISSFWLRRLFRLTPSAWLWLWLTLLAVIFFNRSGVFGSLATNLRDTFAGMFDYANFRLAKVFAEGGYGASGVYWSLSLEEQFYLLLPLAALLLRRWLPALLFAAIAWQALLPGRSQLLVCIRTDALCWGVLLSMFCGSGTWSALEPRWMEKPWLRAPVVIALLFALALAGGAQWDGFGRYKFTLAALLSMLLVWLASYDKGYLFRMEWLRKPLLWIGARSYAIYLIHMPVYFFVRETAVRVRDAAWIPALHVPIAYTLLAVVLIALLADASYRWVETPLREYGARLAARARSPHPIQ